MSYKKVVKNCNDDYISYNDVDTTLGFIVGKFADKTAFIIINGDWYIIDKRRIFKNSSSYKALDYIFNTSDKRYSKDVRQYNNFFEASQYINKIIGGYND